jgi:hypothetical protein
MQWRLERRDHLFVVKLYRQIRSTTDHIKHTKQNRTRI